MLGQNGHLVTPTINYSHSGSTVIFEKSKPLVEPKFKNLVPPVFSGSFWAKWYATQEAPSIQAD
ncbi:hypothetical protein L484_018423 [Morus notabilis]|uniref:Uncharacterized protein n=1 Tax=Morus notabilis TaxID=981085 RepID=W9QK82_9ROSA|nr:hypothetical protein L484_018423 [Morus notabilis]